MFQMEKFKNAALNFRTRDVEVPLLPDSFFDDAGKKTFKVRQLSGNEVAICNEAVANVISARVVIEKMMGSNAREKAVEMCRMLGFSDDTREEIIRGSKMLEFGIVEPAGFPHDQIIRLATFFPIVFKELYHAVLILTGEGASLGE